MAQKPAQFFQAIGSVTVGMPRLTAAGAISASGGVTSTTLWPRAIMPAASVNIRISCPPQPVEDSVCRIESGLLFITV